MGMDFNIQSIRPIANIPENTSSVSKAAGGDSLAFRKVFEDAMSHVEGVRNEANLQVQQFLSGESEDPHKMILSVQNADLTFQLFMQMRNKFTSAYQEVMRMQL